MKKIGILTFHRSFNYGAILQVYSLYDRIKHLCQQNGIKAEINIIDYDSAIHRRSTYFHSGVLVKRPQKIPGILRNYIKVRTLQKFQESQLPLSPERMVTDNFSKATDFINSLNYDLIITGSDEIWRFTKGLPFPNIYMLPEEIKAKKASYAPSANRTIFGDLTSDKRTHIKNCLLDYDYISVRDKYTCDNLYSISNVKQIEICPDPTFGLGKHDCSERIDKVFSAMNIGKSGKPLVALVGLPENVSKSMVQKYSDKYEFCSMVNPCKGIPFINKIDPIEWADVYGRFNICITGLFHGTVFCLKNKIPFITLELDSKYTQFESKVKYLLSQAGLDDRLFEYCNGSWNYEQINVKMQSLLHSDEFDYSKYLACEKAKMDCYLNKVLELVK